jgi:type I restriction enzyme S subunit
LSEQKRIVDLVSSVDSYIAALQQQADAARAARNAVLSELLSTGGEDWSESSVHDVLAVSIGGVWGSNPGVDEIDVYVYRQTEFGNDGRLTMPSDAVRSITHKQFKSRVLQPGDVLMQKSAGTPTLPGRVVIVPPGIESNATCSNFLHLLKSDTDRCTPQFLFWFLWLSYKSGRAFEFQRGTNIRNLDLNEYLAQSMMLPPLAEQKRIVDIASSMDQALQSTERAVLVAKRLRSGLLSDLLSGRHEIPESYDRLLGAA